MVFHAAATLTAPLTGHSDMTRNLTQPPPLTTDNAGDRNSFALVTVYFRRADANGENATVEPVALHPADALNAVLRHPAEYAREGGSFAPWPAGMDTTANPLGGRGRLLSSPVSTD